MKVDSGRRILRLKAIQDKTAELKVIGAGRWNHNSTAWNPSSTPWRLLEFRLPEQKRREKQ